MSVKKKIITETVPSVKECHGSLIFLHGSDGIPLRGVVREKLGKELTFQHLKIHYPSSPFRPYTLNGCVLQRAWFDRIELKKSSPEQSESIETMACTLCQLIDEEIESGISAEKIILGGHSMGGGMVLHLGLRYRPNVAGIFCLASFLNDDSKVFEDLKRKGTSPFPQILMVHGDQDEEVLLEWSQNTRQKLQELGVTPTYEIVQGMPHQITKEGILRIKEWISNIFDN